MENNDCSMINFPLCKDSAFLKELLHGSIVYSGHRMGKNWFNRENYLHILRADDKVREDSADRIKEELSSLFVIGDLTYLAFSDDKLENLSLQNNESNNINPCFGFDSEMASLEEFVSNGLKCSETSDTFASHGLLLCGPVGCGKTFLVESFLKSQRSTNLKYKIVDSSSLFSKHIGELERQLHQLFTDAKGEAPFVLVLDNIDSLAVNQEDYFDSLAGDAGIILLSELDALRTSSAQVFVIGITSAVDRVDKRITETGRLDTTLEISLPSKEQRLAMLEDSMKKLEVEGYERSIFFDLLAQRTHGLLPADIYNFCSVAVTKAISRMEVTEEELADSVEMPKIKISMDDCDKAIIVSQPSQLAEHRVLQFSKDLNNKEKQTPEERLKATFFGMDEAIETLKKSILLPLRNPEVFEKLNIRIPGGVLVCGPSGSGKTALACALGESVRDFAHFITVQCPDVVSKIVGETEKALSKAFNDARRSSPCILFLDQIEALAPIRGNDNSTQKSFDRLLSVLLIEMDGVKASKGQVLVIGASHDENLLDPAIRRPGRFDEIIHLSLPNSTARKEMLQSRFDKMPIKFDKEDIDSVNGVTIPDSKEKLLRFLSGDKSEGLSAPELHSICHEVRV
eukprot:TRINITY_DN1949_c0_g1_i3.p1 TRINITY_DN1949_c0_g1~~TRINITY_DN1949_c0_g1_i3.p1  ORF type:complete len:727 (-),score=189.51 TRINITY_DN1949_c0_g1_i3:469-2349(-)